MISSPDALFFFKQTIFDLPSLIWFSKWNKVCELQHFTKQKTRLTTGVRSTEQHRISAVTSQIETSTPKKAVQAASRLFTKRMCLMLSSLKEIRNIENSSNCRMLSQKEHADESKTFRMPFKFAGHWSGHFLKTKCGIRTDFMLPMKREGEITRTLYCCSQACCKIQSSSGLLYSSWGAFQASLKPAFEAFCLKRPFEWERLRQLLSLNHSDCSN